MKIQSIRIQRFRSISNTAILDCGPLNVFIGKNNAGKSNLLAAIEIMLRHLKEGKVAGSWEASRSLDEFTDRDSSCPLEIGIQFELPEDVNAALREKLTREAPHLQKSIEQIAAFGSIVFILNGALEKHAPFLFTRRIFVGDLPSAGGAAAATGIEILSVSLAVAQELYINQKEARLLRSEVKLLESVNSRLRGEFERFFTRGAEYSPGFILNQLRIGSQVRSSLRREIEALVSAAENLEDLRGGVSQIETRLQEEVALLEKKRTEGTISAFAGEAQSTPEYAGWLMHEYGSITVLHFKETRQPIGREEADELLRLKVRRGGPDRLRVLQQTIRALLGVNVDAFEADSRSPERVAEMDIDEFLVEANGAGIREALRLILDLELKNPQLVLIEEPEVHLHPGLERAVEAYLRDKSEDAQMFITSHSTNFVDATSFQNVYLVHRSINGKTECDSMSLEDGAFRIPAELGLRLSSVFMFDRLVFVEGPSDEGVFRAIARSLGVDFAKSNVGFVQMSGVRNFAHFAAERTLELLTRRQIKIWFVVDRDESGDGEVNRLITSLGDRAKLSVLRRRELENYLLDPDAVGKFIAEKQGTPRQRVPIPSHDMVASAIKDASEGLKDEVLRLRFEKAILKPIYLQSRTNSGTPEERLQSAVEELKRRILTLEENQRQAVTELEKSWPGHALEIAPGALILAKAAQGFGVTFRKDAGDSVRIARLMSPSSIATELKMLLEDIGGEN